MRSVQFDLFLHSADVIAENELREAIRAGDVGKAKNRLNELAERNPGYGKLDSAAVLIEALDVAYPFDPTTTRAYLDRLEREWASAARVILGDGAKALLAPFWRAAGQALESMAFDPDNPGCHASRAYLECEDWEAVTRTAQAEVEFEKQPVLLERMAESLWRLGQTTQAIERWFALCWLAPGYFERLIKSDRFPAVPLLTCWNKAGDVDMDPRISAEWYPAWALIDTRGLARAIKSRDAEAGPERAFDLVRELMMSDDEQLALRQELEKIHPGLLRYFLQNKV